MTTQTNQSNKSGRSFAEVAPQRGELPPFIEPNELAKFDNFTLIGARIVRSKFGQQIGFDVAIKVVKSPEFPTGIRRATVTLSVNDEREEIMQQVKANKFLTGVRLDRIETPGNRNGYWKFVDSSTPRPEHDEGATGDGGDAASELKDDDIPF